MTVVVCLFLILFILSFWRRLHQSYVKQKFVFEIFEIRDEVRMLAINEEIDPSGRLFQSIDRSFSEAIKEAYFITFFRIAMKGLKLVGDENFKRFSHDYEQQMAENPKLRECMYKFSYAFKDYLVSQHYISYVCFIKPTIILLLDASAAKKTFTRVIRSSLYQPGSKNDGNYILN